MSGAAAARAPAGALLLAGALVAAVTGLFFVYSVLFPLSAFWLALSFERFGAAMPAAVACAHGAACCLWTALDCRRPTGRLPRSIVLFLLAAASVVWLLQARDALSALLFAPLVAGTPLALGLISLRSRRAWSPRARIAFYGVAFAWLGSFAFPMGLRLEEWP